MSRTRPASLADDDAGSDQLLFAEPQCPHALQQVVAGARRVADAKADDCLLAQLTLLHVGAGQRALVGEERVTKEAQRGLVHLDEGIARSADGRRAVGQYDPGTRGEAPQRGRELRVLYLHDEGEHVAAGRAGAEATPRLTVGEHDERRRVLLVERTSRVVVLPGPLQIGDEVLDHIDDVDAGLDVVRYRHEPAPRCSFTRDPQSLRLGTAAGRFYEQGSRGRASGHMAG